MRIKHFNFSLSIATVCLLQLTSLGRVECKDNLSVAQVKSIFDLTEKEQVFIDIFKNKIFEGKEDVLSLEEINGQTNLAYEEAFDCYLNEVKDGKITRQRYLQAVDKAANKLAEGLGFLSPADSRGLNSLSRGDCVSLLIGINYENSESALSNCINDIDHVYNFFLKPLLAVKKQNVIYMSDDQRGTSLYPTRDNILAQFAHFVALANQTKKAYFHYSGHGSKVRDQSGDELDRYDEALVPVDYEESGFLLDDDIYRYLVRKLLPDVTLIITTDCCHSGTILDLPYSWKSNGTYSIENSLSQQELNSLPFIVMLSGCLDSQTSADGGPITFNNEGSGALTGAYLKVLKDRNYKITYVDLMLSVNDLLRRNGFTQRPQITSTRMLNLNDYYLNSQRAVVLVN